MVFEKEINNRFAGLRLDAYLAEKYTYHTRNQWQKKISDGRVLLNGKPAKSSTKIPRDSSLSYDIGDYQELPVNENYSVLLDDEAMLVINKPPNIPVHTSGKYFNNTLIKLLRRDFPDTRLDLVNRLDRETSGIILLAKTASARKNLGDQFRFKRVRKTYITYVFGEPKEDHFTVNAPIAEDVSTVVRIRMGVDARGLPAETAFEVVARKNGFAKLLCYPITGRTNQIRVHLAHIGHPVVGDKLYSGNDADFLEFIEQGNTPAILERVIMERQALHAHRTVFRHPDTDEEVDLLAPEPEDMLEFERSHMNQIDFPETKAVPHA